MYMTVFSRPPKFGGGERFSDFAPPKISRLGGASPPQNIENFTMVGGGEILIDFFRSNFSQEIEEKSLKFYSNFFSSLASLANTKFMVFYCGPNHSSNFFSLASLAITEYTYSIATYRMNCECGLMSCILYSQSLLHVVGLDLLLSQYSRHVTCKNSWKTVARNLPSGSCCKLQSGSCWTSHLLKTRNRGRTQAQSRMFCDDLRSNFLAWQNSETGSTWAMEEVCIDEEGSVSGYYCPPP